MKKKILIGFVITLLLVALLPFPQTIEKTYYGRNTNNNESVDIKLNMRYLRFLLLPDKMYGTITIKTPTDTFTYGEHLYYTGQTALDPERGRMHNLNGWYYNETMYQKEYTHGTVS